VTTEEQIQLAIDRACGDFLDSIEEQVTREFEDDMGDDVDAKIERKCDKLLAKQQPRIEEEVRRNFKPKT
jgi:hypothetical protein